MNGLGERKLDLINKMCILRNGDVPVPVVILRGRSENVDFVLRYEQSFLGTYYNEPKGDKPKRGTVNFVRWCDTKPLDSWFQNPHELIDVNKIACIDWNEFINRLGLVGVTKEAFQDYTPEMVHALKEREDKIVATVLYSHYECCDDNNVTDDDLKLILKLVTDSKTKEVPKSVKPMGNVASPKDSVRKGRGEIKTDKETKSNEALVGSESVPSVATESDSMQKLLDAAISKQKEMEEKEQSEASKEENEEEVSDIPVPKTKAEKKPLKNAKETLTVEEEQKNEVLLSDLRDLYKNTIRYLNETCNSQYKIIVNKMQDAVDKNIYKQSFTKMYFDISDDTSTELYKALYDVDIATQKFHKSVTHQVKHLGCFNCGTEWDEDITFLEKGPHTVRCPKCFNDYPFEK